MGCASTVHPSSPARLACRFFGTKLAGIPPALLCVCICIFLVLASISSSTGAINKSHVTSYPAEGIHPEDWSPADPPPGAYSYAGDGDDELLQSHGRHLSQLASENPCLSLLGFLGSLFTCLTACQVRTPLALALALAPPLALALDLALALALALAPHQVRKAIRKRDGIPETNCQG